jgi:hypothetical protein
MLMYVGGNRPFNLLLATSSNCRFVSRDHKLGRLPSMLLLEMENTCRDESNYVGVLKQHDASPP